MSRINNRKAAFLEAVTERQKFVDNSKDYIRFNFKYYIYGDDGGESFEDWEKEQILADLNNKIRDFSAKTKKELINEKTLELFSHYPQDSKFKKPKSLQELNIIWARLRITGARRLIGFFMNLEDKENTFYVVFLDKNHMFAPYIKKNT